MALSTTADESMSVNNFVANQINFTSTGVSVESLSYKETGYPKEVQLISQLE